MPRVCGRHTDVTAVPARSTPVRDHITSKGEPCPPATPAPGPADQRRPASGSATPVAARRSAGAVRTARRALDGRAVGRRGAPRGAGSGRRPGRRPGAGVRPRGRRPARARRRWSAPPRRSRRTWWSAAGRCRRSPGSAARWSPCWCPWRRCRSASASPAAAVPKFGLAYAGVAGALAVGQLLIEIYRGSSSTSRPGVEVLAGARVLTSSVEVRAGWMLGLVALALTVLAGCVATCAWGRTVMEDGGALDPRPVGAGRPRGAAGRGHGALPRPAGGRRARPADHRSGHRAADRRHPRGTAGPARAARAGAPRRPAARRRGACSAPSSRPSLRPRLAAVGGLLALTVTVLAAGLTGAARRRRLAATCEWTLPGIGLRAGGSGARGAHRGSPGGSAAGDRDDDAARDRPGLPRAEPRGGRTHPGGHRQARPRRARPRRQGRRPRAARRRHGGHLHRPAPDARADRRDRRPGGRRRRRPVGALRRAHDAVRPGRRAAAGARRRRHRRLRRRHHPRGRHPRARARSASPQVFTPGATTTEIVDWVRAHVGARRRDGADAGRAPRMRTRRASRTS